jgi:hypothetical protein
MRKGKGGDEASAGRRGRRQSRGGGQAAGKEEGRPGEEEEEEDEKGECMMHGVSGSGLAGEVFVGEVDRERGRGRVGSPVGRATHV